MTRGVDRFWQFIYRVGFRCAQHWWRLRRPDHNGVVVAVWLNGEILAVTQSYQDTLTWPGGGIEPREEARDSAVRELREELGLVVGPQELIYVDTVTVDWRFRNDCVRLFELKLNARPHLHLDNREIIAARFMAPAAMLLADPPPFVAPYLRRHIEGDSIHPG